MKFAIPVSRPVNGADLNALRERLGLSVSDACWLYGLSMEKWSETVKRNAREPLKKIPLALMARALSAHPALCPIPQAPTVQKMFELVKRHREYIDKKRFAIMFGGEGSAGYRWMTVKTKTGTIQNRLFLVFQSLVTFACHPSLEKKTSLEIESSAKTASDAVAQWERLVIEEAHSRGIQGVFQTGCWKVKDEQNQSKRIKGEDIDKLREKLGLSVMDACWLFGMSMSKWTEIVKKSSKSPLKSPSLSLLVRVLQINPNACPMGKLPNPVDVYESIACNQRGMDKKRMAVMFGCEASSGHRWLTVGNKLGTSLHRTLKVFAGWYGPSLCDNQTTTAQGIRVISEWDKLVEIEASTRGIDNVFSTGRWTTEEPNP